MIFGREQELKKEISAVGKKVHALRMVAGTSGNISCRLSDERILITATATALGELAPEDIVCVDLADPGRVPAKKPTTELPLHSLIYRHFPHQVVIHCHPALTNGYFCVYADIKALTFETKLYISSVPVVAQETPAVTKPEEVVEALGSSNIVVLKNHGVVSVGKTFREALNLIEMLEDAVKTASVARLYKKEILDELDCSLKEELASAQAYAMFSREHIQAIVERVNADELIRTKGRELGLSMQYAIRMENSPLVHKFTFEEGRIVRLDADAEAPFVATAPEAVWELVFLGKLDPFVAVTQGKMKLKGDLGKLSRWYVPLSRLFQIFKQVPIR